MTESSPQPNEQPQPRRRNIYDYDGEYEFPTLCSIGPRQAFQHRPRQVISASYCLSDPARQA
jgi:hypothetical protein